MSRSRLKRPPLCRLSQKPHACIYVGMASLTEFSLDQAIGVLTRTPATLDALLRGLPVIWVRSNEGKDTWSAFDIVGHLIFGERTDWMPRVRMILENGEARPFDLTHVHQLSRVMAHQYRDQVGPWSAYLGVLQCSGHSAP
jgi:hypothetical protein